MLSRSLDAAYTESAKMWSALSANGFKWHRPRMSPTSLDWAISSPRTFLFAKALGIQPRYQREEPLSRGTWFHSFLEHDSFDLSPTALEQHLRDRTSDLLLKRREGLEAEWREQGLLGDTRSELHAQERGDYENMLSMYVAYSQCRFPFLRNRTFREYLSQEFQLLSREFRCYHPSFTIFSDEPNLRDCLQSAAVCVFDMLLFNPHAKTLWILDAKTTAASPRNRMASCPVSFQTLFMLDMADQALPSLIKTFSLPPETTLGGVMHMVFQKPGIELSGTDRAFTIDTTPFKAGPRKGEPRNEKVYHGEPIPANYQKRLSRWIKSEEEYLSLQEARQQDPVFNISHTSVGAFDLSQSWYTNTLLEFDTICNTQPSYLFTKGFTEQDVYSAGRFGPYAPLLLTHPKQWGSVFAREGFKIRHGKQKENTKVLCPEIPGFLDLQIWEGQQATRPQESEVPQAHNAAEGETQDGC
jgi:hypothetical protein